MKLCPQCGRTLQDGFQICPDDGAKLAVPGQILRGAPVTVTASSSLRQAADNHHSPPWVKFAMAGGAVLIIIGVIAIVVLQALGSQRGPQAVSVDELIQAGETKKAVAILQKWKARHIETKSDCEKLDALLIDMAATASDQHRFQDAIALLGKVDAASPRHKEAQHLIEGLRGRGSIGFASGHSGSVK